MNAGAQANHATLAARGLPAIAYSKNLDESPGQAPVIAFRRGEMGYWPIFTYRTAEELNDIGGVSEAQAMAMHVGSVRGWEVPGANPANW